MSYAATASLVRVAGDFSFPSSLAFSPDGTAYVAESGVPFAEGAPPGRIWRVDPDGARTKIADGLSQPVNGLAYRDGSLYLATGDDPGRIIRIDSDGSQATVLDHLPGPGNYHVNSPIFGPDGKLYFSQGAMTNTAIIGLDAYELGWLRRLPHAHDVPGLDIELAGVNARTPDPSRGDGQGSATTGAFVPFGRRTDPGERIAAGLPCTAAIMRCEPDGSDLELVAWGLRNAYGLGFLPDGRLLATDQGADDRGSRPIGDVADLLFEVREGCWYGWPDFVGGEPVTDARYLPERGPTPSFVLANHDELPAPEKPLLRFPAHVAATKFDVAPASAGRYAGHLFVALFGDERPMTAPAGPAAGRSIVRIDPRDWSMHDFATGPLSRATERPLSRAMEERPLSWPIERPLSRPIDIRFGPHDGEMYVLDFGRFEMTGEKTVSAEPETGALWKVTDWR